MSENTDSPESGNLDRDLESLLRGLEPARLEQDQIESLHRAYRITRAESAHDPTRPQWRRVIPLTLAACLAMFAYGAYRTAPVLNRGAGEIVADTSTAPVPGELARLSQERFVPVSAQGYVVNTSSGGVVDTEGGPRERVTVEYEDAYHWHDPNTGTNVRYFHPRNEEFALPLRTD